MHEKERARGGMPILHRSTALVPRTQDDDSPIIIQVLKNSISGLLAFIVIGIILISTMTAIAYANADPDALIMPLSLIALLISAFSGGFICSKRTGNSPLLCGIVCGGVITIFTMLIALLIHNAENSRYELWQELILHGTTVIFCILGALAGNVKRKVDPRKYRRFK